MELAEQISGASAADIGRLHLDPVAWRAAMHIGTSALSASVSGQGIYPQALFPFEGNTTLVAAGKWLPLGERPQLTFVVFSLRLCSHPFPFQSLHYECKAKNPRQQQRLPTDSEQAANRRYRSSAHDSPNQQLVEQDGSSKLAKKVRTARSEPRFPDLKKKTIWKSATLASSESGPPPIYTKANSVDSAAVGEPGSERRIRAIDLAVLTGPNSAHMPAPEFLRSTVEELKRLRGIDVELLTQSQHDGWTVPVTMLSNDDGEIDRGLFFDPDSGMLNLRRAAVFALKRNGEHVSLVIIESSPIHVKLYPTTGIDPQEIWATLQCATGDFLARPESGLACIDEVVNWAFGIASPEMCR